MKRILFVICLCLSITTYGDNKVRIINLDENVTYEGSCTRNKDKVWCPDGNGTLTISDGNTDVYFKGVFGRYIEWKDHFEGDFTGDVVLPKKGYSVTGTFHLNYNKVRNSMGVQGGKSVNIENKVICTITQNLGFDIFFRDNALETGVRFEASGIDVQAYYPELYEEIKLFTDDSFPNHYESIGFFNDTENGSNLILSYIRWTEGETNVYIEIPPADSYAHSHWEKRSPQEIEILEYDREGRASYFNIRVKEGCYLQSGSSIIYKFENGNTYRGHSNFDYEYKDYHDLLNLKKRGNFDWKWDEFFKGIDDIHDGLLIFSDGSSYEGSFKSESEGASINGDYLAESSYNTGVFVKTDGAILRYENGKNQMQIEQEEKERKAAELDAQYQNYLHDCEKYGTKYVDAWEFDGQIIVGTPEEYFLKVIDAKLYYESDRTRSYHVYTIGGDLGLSIDVDKSTKKVTRVYDHRR